MVTSTHIFIMPATKIKHSKNQKIYILGGSFEIIYDNINCSLV